MTQGYGFFNSLFGYEGKENDYYCKYMYDVKSPIYKYWDSRLSDKYEGGGQCDDMLLLLSQVIGLNVYET